MKFLKTTSHCPGFSEALVPLLRVLLAVSVLFFAASQVCLVLAQTDEEPNPSDQLVHIPDPALRSALEEALGKTAGEDITQAEMATLTGLSASRAGVRDLTGLEYATNVTNLGLRSNPIADITPLKAMTRLRYLYMNGNWIVDVSPLKGLTQLERVDLKNNQIVDVSPLAQLPNLTSLNLAGNRISDLPLFEHSKLQWLDLRHNRIEDVSPLAHSKLGILYLSGNPVSDFSSLSGLSLVSYDFHVAPEVTPEGIAIPDPILRKAILVALDKSAGATITESDMERLEAVTVRWGATDFTGLEHAINLETLNLIGGSAISDLEPLVKVLMRLTHLRHLTIRYRQLVDISPLKNLTQLETLNLMDNQLVDISPLKHLTQLVGLRLSRNEIVDVSPLKPLMANLRSLHIFGNRISDFSSIAEYLPKRNGELVNTYNYSFDPPNYVPPILPDHAVDISDAGLRAALEAALNKEAGSTIMRSDLETLTSLDASNRGIRDLRGLQYASNLTALNITDNQITDVSYISGLMKLVRLELAGNVMSDMSGLGNLAQLTHLDVSRNLILNVNVLPFHALSNLKTLNLSGNVIKYVSRLRELSSLTTLNLAGNNVADVSPLASLTQLKKLYLRDNPATDFSALYELIPNLDDADFSYQPVETEQPNPQTPGDETLQGIAIPDAALREALEAALGKASGETITQADMETLRRFNVNRAGIQDLTGLEYAINLRRLDLARNQISDVSALSGLTQLRRLDLRRNRISDFSPIAGLTDNLARYRKGNQKTGRPKNTPINVDVNRNGVVDATDLDIVSRYEGRQLSSVESGLYPDVNGDGKIDTKDVLAVTERLPSGSVSGTGQ